MDSPGYFTGLIRDAIRATLSQLAGTDVLLPRLYISLVLKGALSSMVTCCRLS